jgi:hypothetical protein
MKMSTKQVVKAWAGLPKEPARNRSLKALWQASGTPAADDWGKGAAKLAKQLQPHLRSSQIVNQEAIQALKPNTVGTLVDSLQMGSRQIVKAWANLTTLPANAADLKALWAGSGDPLSADWNAGAAKLACDLHPDLRPGQVVDQAFILALNPSTVAQLTAQLGW